MRKIYPEAKDKGAEELFEVLAFSFPKNIY